MASANKRNAFGWNPGKDQVLRQKLKAVREHDALMKAWADSTLNLKVDEMVVGRGIFLGQYRPVDRNGNSLQKVFNVFAAPEDLPDESGSEAVFKYADAVKRISKLQNWHGHDGTHYANDEEIYQALRDGSYDGGWIIPTSDLLLGKDVDDNDVQPDNLSAHRERGALRNTFCTQESEHPDCQPDWYWSSTEMRTSPRMQSLRFADGCEGIDNKFVRLSCRPVRLERILPKP